MKTAALSGGGTIGDKNADDSHISTPTGAATQVAFPDLPGLRARLVGVRRRLLERLADDWPDDRRFPDSAWCRMLSDVQTAIAAVDDVVREGRP